MLAVEFTALFTLSALVALGSIAGSILAALPRIAQLRQELAAMPETRELRFTITEVVVTHHDGKVVPLPLRKKRLPQLVQATRAAA